MGLACSSGVGFSAGVIASVILFRRAYGSFCFRRSLFQPPQPAVCRERVADCARLGVRCWHGVRRLRPVVQPRKDTRHARYPGGREEGLRISLRVGVDRPREVAVFVEMAWRIWRGENKRLEVEVVQHRLSGGQNSRNVCLDSFSPSYLPSFNPSPMRHAR